MNELIANAGIAVVVCGALMLYIEWRSRAYSSTVTRKVDAVMQKLLDMKFR